MSRRISRSPDLVSAMSRLQIDSPDSTPAVATIFISAHSVEMSAPLYPEIEVRMVNSQSAPGRHNFENPASIQEKLRFWSDAMQTRGDQRTIDVLQHGIAELNARADAEVKSTITSRMKPLRSRTNAMGEQVDPKSILIRVREILDSKENNDLFFNNLDYHFAIDPEDDNERKKRVSERRARFLELLFTLDDPFNDLEFIKLVKSRNPAEELLNTANVWLEEQFDKYDEESTNRARLDHVITDKLFQMGANEDEDPDDVEASLYGIHLIQDSKNESGIRAYRRFVDTSNVLMNLKQELTDDDGNVSYITEYKSEPFKPKIPTIKTAANAYFGPRLGWRPNRPYQNTIYLSEIITFFQQQGYSVLNIIDTGCRNFNVLEENEKQEKFGDTLSLVMRTNRLLNKANRALDTKAFSHYGKTIRRSKRKRPQSRSFRKRKSTKKNSK